MIGEATPAVEKVKAIGHSSEERDSLLFPWIDKYTFPREVLELLSIAFDAAYVHIYGTRRHIKDAFKTSATVAKELERNSAA